jgi:hypothetical protein
MGWAALCGTGRGKPGLCWPGLGWAGQRWPNPASAGMCRAGLGWVALGPVGPGPVSKRVVQTLIRDEPFRAGHWVLPKQAELRRVPQREQGHSVGPCLAPGRAMPFRVP